MIYPLRFSFITPILEDLPFLFLVQFLSRLIGICQFPWFQPGNISHTMVHHPSNSVGQSSLSFPYRRLIFLIRLVLYQYGYVADIPLSQLLRGQDPENRQQNLYTEQGTPYFRMVTEKQMQAYFGWRIATVCCFTNYELNYLHVLFAIDIPMQSLIRDYQRVQISVGLDADEEYYHFRPVGFNGRLVELEELVDGREYTLQERQQIILAYQSGNLTHTNFLIIQEEVKIYERRRVEGYLVDRALDIDRLGPGLGHIVEAYCQANERPFPNRGDAELSVPDIQLLDIERKVTPITGEYRGEQRQRTYPVVVTPVMGESLHSSREDCGSQFIYIPWR